jgi:putative transposase
VGPGEERNESRIKQGEAAVWQRRYWVHMIRDEQDLRRHEDYIQQILSGGCNPADFIRTNPVKHGLVQRVVDWQWSSFHRYVRMEYYERN